MSYSSSRRNALDQSKPLMHRASHARSCAMLVAQKWKIHRDTVFQRLQELCGVDLTDAPSSDDLETAIAHLEQLRREWSNPSDETAG